MCIDKRVGSTMKNIIIFTDLDGTLLSEAYSFDSALPALALIDQHRIPLVICSSKTRSEIEIFRARLNNNHPFISENGGGVFIPRGYFGPNVVIPGSNKATEADYELIRLGAQYKDLRKTLIDLQKEGFSIEGFGDMTAEEVAKAMGLTIEEAKMAKQRDFDEPFFFEGKEGEIENLFDSIRAKGFNVTKGKIYHLLGQSDKGRAVSFLIDLYRQKLDAIVTVGLGDSPNDIPMLAAVDVPVAVQKPDGSHDLLLKIPKLFRAQGIGPEGWNNIVKELIPQLISERATRKILIQ